MSEVKETLIILDDGSNTQVKNVPNRQSSRIAKAPQCFRICDILKCHEDAKAKGKKDYIDSCTMMVDYGYKLHTVDGSYDNIKITTPDDFMYFAQYWKQEKMH